MEAWHVVVGQGQVWVLFVLDCAEAGLAKAAGKLYELGAAAQQLTPGWGMVAGVATAVAQQLELW